MNDKVKTNTPTRILLIVGCNNSFAARLIEKIHAIPTAGLEDVVLWKPHETLWARFKRSYQKEGWLYIPYRLVWLMKDLYETVVKTRIETLFLIPRREDDLFATCFRLGTRIHRVDNLHAPHNIDFIRSLNCDLIVACGTAPLKKSIWNSSRLGAINLHQGYIENHGDAPSVNGAPKTNGLRVGTAIYLMTEDFNQGEIVLQQQLPVFEYDDLESVKGKLEELSLLLYPIAIQQILIGQTNTYSQPGTTGNLYLVPSLSERLRLYWNLKRGRLSILGIVKNVAKKFVYVCGLAAISSRDFFIRNIAKKNILSVLYYHRVTNVCQDGMTVSLKEFEWQIRFLKKRYSLLSTADLDEWLQGNGKIRGKKGILITFDDGYEDNYVNALPILRKYSCPAIFFVSTGLIDNNRQFEHDSQIQPLLTFKKMTWRQLQDAIASNIEIGIHSDTHANLARIPIEDSIREIETSIHKYKHFLGKKPRMMAFPFGGKEDITPQIVDYIKNGGQIDALFSAYGNKNISPIDRWNIKRINIGSKNIGLTFWLKVEGGIETLCKLFEP